MTHWRPEGGDHEGDLEFAVFMPQRDHWATIEALGS